SRPLSADVFYEPVPYRADVGNVSGFVREDSFGEEFPIYAFAGSGEPVLRFLSEGKERRGVGLFDGLEIFRQSETEVVEVDRFLMERRVRKYPIPLFRYPGNRRPSAVTPVTEAGLETLLTPRMVDRTGMPDSRSVEVEVFAHRIRRFYERSGGILRNFQRHAAKSRAFFATVGKIESVDFLCVVISEVHAYFLPAINPLSIRYCAEFPAFRERSGFF
ncbi:MAG: hypothetical protein QG650_644, partial [Patescibacteria group bacterium]|nr:hypothetical protein [Patescibacteria group bacterium]